LLLPTGFRQPLADVFVSAILGLLHPDTQPETLQGGHSLKCFKSALNSHVATAQYLSPPP
jgi:hypothetical protein